MPSSLHQVLFLSFIDGLKSALAYDKVVLILSRSSAIRQIVLKILFLNGVVWLGSLLFFDIIFKGHHIFGWSYATATGYPMYLICLWLNSGLFDQMAKETIQLQRNGSSFTSSSASTSSISSSASLSVTSTIRLATFYMNCALLVNLLRWIPYIGTFLGFAMNSIVMAYYCFEYKWIDLGWTQEHRLSFVEQNWAYFLGFGLPATLLTFFLSTLHAAALFALSFPSFVMMASFARMTPYMTGQQQSIRLPVLFGLRALNKMTFALIHFTHRKLFNRLTMDYTRKDSLGKLV